MSSKSKAGQTRRFGIGEWYGLPFTSLSTKERQELAAAHLKKPAGWTKPPCPFQSSPGVTVSCSKAGGICTFRLYEGSAGGKVTAVVGQSGGLRTLCPHRFEEKGLIQEWVGETILKTTSPLIVKEVGFLQRAKPEEEGLAQEGKEDVGRIDKILVVADRDPMQWCALEEQAVYFSGAGMRSEWVAVESHSGPGLPFPASIRRPDYRSSGPKRLMPQLQIKVPSLRRWGKKMAVVVDQDFWSALGEMEPVRDLSNCDIAWFVVKYEEDAGQLRIVKDKVHFTTLERSIEGLTAGLPVSLETFEERIRRKLSVSR